MNASCVKSVPFEEAVVMISGLRRAEIVVRFKFMNADDKPVSMKSMKLSALYRDWYGECAFCPSNDACINGLHILLPTHVALDINESVPFGKFMDAVESVTKGWKFVDR